MNYLVFLVGFFSACISLSTVYGAADGWVDFGGITVPTDECIFDGDGNSYIFMCDSDGNMTSSFYSGEDDCSNTPVTTAVSGLEYECDPVGFVRTEVLVSNPLSGSSDCAISYASTAVATGICHYSNLDGAYVMYVIMGFISLSCYYFIFVCIFRFVFLNCFFVCLFVCVFCFCKMELTSRKYVFIFLFFVNLVLFYILCFMFYVFCFFGFLCTQIDIPVIKLLQLQWKHLLILVVVQVQEQFHTHHVIF